MNERMDRAQFLFTSRFCIVRLDENKSKKNEPAEAANPLLAADERDDGQAAVFLSLIHI